MTLGEAPKCSGRIRGQGMHQKITRESERECHGKVLTGFRLICIHTGFRPIWTSADNFKRLR